MVKSFIESYQPRLLILLLLVSIVSGCGFQLRGAFDLSGELSSLHMKHSTSFELARELKSILSANNVLLTEKANKANLQLILLNEEKRRSVLTVDGNGQVREYSLSYTVYFSIKNKGSTEEVKHSVLLSRSLLFNTDAVLAVTNESEILYKDMQRNAARLILLKLQAHVKTTSKTIPVNNDLSDDI